MIRQPASAEAKPFESNIIADQSILKAVDFDLGRNGVAYFDTDTADYRSPGQRAGGNRGRVYRNDGADIRKDSVRYETYYISDIDATEWLQYTVDVKQKGTYTLKFNVAAAKADGAFTFTSNTKKFIPKKIAVPNTGGLKNWQTFEIKDVALTAGKQTFRIYADTGCFNLGSVQFLKQK